MSTVRKLSIALCLLGFVAVCALAFASTMPRPFNGLSGIQSDLASEAEAIVRTNAPGSVITADGRDIEVQLPEFVGAGYDPVRLQADLAAINGVRSVDLIGDPATPVSPDDVPTVRPTVEPVAEPTAVPPTAVPPTAVPPTAVPPTAVPTPEPAAEPTAEPTAESAGPSLADVVGGIDLTGLQFERGTARFTAQDTAALDSVADQLQGFSNGTVQVQAHTDNVGDPDANLLLSQDRALAVVAYLIDRGVDSSLLSARGFGAQAPIANNSTEQGRAANQRVVLVVEGN